MCLRPVNINGHKIITSCIHFLDNTHIFQGILLFFGCSVPLLAYLFHIKLQLFFSHTHQFIGKSCGTDTEICTVISQRLEYLEPGDSVCHHNVSCRMGFREHIFDFFAGPDIPVRNAVFFHGGDPLISETFSFTDALHNSKGKTTFHTLTDQVDHNIITGTDCRGNSSFSLFNQCLRISQPYIRTVGKSGNTDQIRKIFRLGIHKHLHGEISTKFWNSQTAKLAAADILRINSKSFCTGKK